MRRQKEVTERPEKQKEETFGKSGYQKTLDGISTALTAASLIPGLDTFTNIAQIPVDLLRGDFLGAGLDLVGVVPFVGEVADTTKLARGATKALSKADEVSDVLKVAEKADDISDAAKHADKGIDASKAAEAAVDASNTVEAGNIISLPPNQDQLKHIFADRPGHIPDTPSNRKLLTDTASNPEYYHGTDRYGNKWHIQIDSKGRQIRTRSQNGKINNAGRNNTPLRWDEETGLYNNPVKRK